MKHPYAAGCDCKRCAKERARRDGQSRNENARQTIHKAIERSFRPRPKGSRRPVVGSQEWAETRGDDIDSPSGDY